MPTRIVSFAGSSVRIRSDGREAEGVVDFLFRDIPAAATPAPHVAFEVEGARPDGTLSLRSDDAVLYEGTSPGALARMLVERAAFHLSDRSAGGLVLHAAAVEREGQAILLPGKTGAGKSTLTAWLVARGYRYLTDELVFIPSGTTTVVPFARPLNIRASGLAALEAAGIQLAGGGAEILQARNLSLLRPPPSDGGLDRAPALRAIVFPRYRAGEAFNAGPVSKAEAGLSLMACLINARNLPGHGHGEVARLARETPGLRVTYSDARAVEEWMAVM